MNFLKKYKYPLTATLGLIAVFFIFQNGTCNNNGSYTGTNSEGQRGGGGGSPSALSVSPLNATVVPGGTVRLTGIGGVAPYTYVVSFGGGSVSSAGVYTAPNAQTAVGITVTDANGSQAFANITVTNSTPNPTALNLTAASYTVNTGATVQLTASGGTSPYVYSIISGGGSVSSSGLFTAPSTAGTVLVKVTDNASQTAQVSLTVQNGPGAFTKAETNSLHSLHIWAPVHAIDQYADSCYSSLSNTYFSPSVKPYLLLTIGESTGNSVYPISKLRLAARRVNNMWSGFPASYTVKVLSADGQSWTNVGTFQNQPEFDGIARVTFSQTYYTKKVVIIADVMTKDDKGTYYYFQVCDIKQ